MKQDKIRIGLQKDGRLKQYCLDFLSSKNITCPDESGRRLITACIPNKVEIVWLRHSDIPLYVERGVVDFGIVGENRLLENVNGIPVLKKLGFGKCRLVIAVPEASTLNQLSHLEGQRIATTYPQTLRRFLQKNKINTSIIKLDGSVEVAPELGLSDGICDIVQTGKTLQEHDLRILSEVCESEAVLIGNPASSKKEWLFSNPAP